MSIAILGTGIVGKTLAEALAAKSYEVVLGTRDVAATLARQEGDTTFESWLQAYPSVQLTTFADAVGQADVILNATSGQASLAILNSIGEANLNDKIMIDISNPLDFSQGMPPSLFVSNTDSLAEQIQRAFPNLKVVKALNTLTAALMVNPQALANGEHDIFVCGNDGAARATVSDYLKEWFGWKHVIDLGDITAARGTEMYLPLWLRLWGSLGTGMFNIKVVK